MYQHFKQRKLEWMMAFILLSIGLYMFFVPQSFDFAAFAVLKANQELVTAICVLGGLARVIGLFINGLWPSGTPSLRFVGSLAGVTIFGAMAGTIIGSGASSWAIFVYLGLMMGELINSYYTASDMANHTKYNKE